MKNLLIFLALATFTTQIFATEFKGFDNKGRRCRLELITLDSTGSEIKGEIKINYSDSEFSVSHFAGEVGRVLRGQISENHNDVGELPSSYEGEFVSLKLDEELRPVEVTYYNNIGLIRFLKPFSRVCNF